MSLINDVGVDGCSVIWTIQNFSYSLQKPGENFDSPSFTLNTCNSATFRLTLKPRGLKRRDFSETENDIFFGLVLENLSISTRVQYALSVRTNSGSFMKLKDLTCALTNPLGVGQVIMKREELRGIGSETFLDNDTLTLRCRIMKVDDELIPPGQCHLRTSILVGRMIHNWSLEKFRQNMSSDEIAEKQPSVFKISTIVETEFSLCGDTFKLEIKHAGKDKKCFLTCDLSLLEDTGKVVHSMRHEHWFEKSAVSQVLTIPFIPITKILKYEKPYLRCELAVCSGREFSCVERIENGKIVDQQSTSCNYKAELDLSNSLKEDLQRFYTGGLCTDLTIRTQTKDFPAHRSILCARSTVFHAMFEQDMEEHRTGVVNIEDVDADTAHKMLKFVYSDTLEDLDCDVACKLYFAADKYRITALRRRCSNFLKEHLSVANACQVLVLADMHQDEDLKSFVQDFLVSNAVEVMRSEEWKMFMQDQVPLASEIQRMLSVASVDPVEPPCRRLWDRFDALLRGFETDRERRTQQIP